MKEGDWEKAARQEWRAEARSSRKQGALREGNKELEEQWRSRADISFPGLKSKG